MGIYRSASRSTRKGSSWHGTAFVIEALILLAFFLASIAVFMQLFGAASAQGIESRELSRAVVLAANAAKRFSADPEQAGGTTETEDGLSVSCTVEPERTDAGTLYRATIVVFSNGAELYRLETARYESGVQR